MKWHIPIIMTLLMLTGVTALEICTHTIEVLPDTNANCTMLTPELAPSTHFNYTIFNLEGAVVTTGNLAELNNSIYFFNFTESKGDYIIKLNDGTTREVSVVEDSKMLNILYLIIFANLALLVLAYTFKDYTFAAMSGILMIITGVWITINGIADQNMYLTLAFGTALIGLGAYLFIRSAMDMWSVGE